MPTMPVARPSSPSTKFTALMVGDDHEHGEQGDGRRVEENWPPPTDRQRRSWMPCAAMSPAASTWPASLVMASSSQEVVERCRARRHRPRRSARSGRRLEHRSGRCATRNGSWSATTIAAAKPPGASPARRSAGSARRARRGRAPGVMAPMRSAICRISGRREVGDAPRPGRRERYSRIGPPRPAARRGDARGRPAQLVEPDRAEPHDAAARAAHVEDGRGRTVQGAGRRRGRPRRCRRAWPSAASASVAARRAGEVGRADRERAGALEQRQGDRWSGIRTATVPRVSPRSQFRDGCWLRRRG